MIYEEEIGKILIQKGFTIAVAESCTGGLLSSRLTDVSGSSSYITLNLVTYANEAKHKMLGVSEDTLSNFGAVSRECAYEMAKGLFSLTGADICVSTTGIAGPGGGTPQKPVGLCYAAVMYNDIIEVERILLNPEIPRKEMKEHFAAHTLELIKKVLHL